MIEMELPSVWIPLTVTFLVGLLGYLITRPRTWYERQLFRLHFYRILAFGPLAPIFPPGSKPPSRQALAFASIFARLPKSNTPRPAAERKAAFDKLGILQSKHDTVHFRPVVHVPHQGISGRKSVPVYPLEPEISIVGKAVLYLHAGTYISGSITSHGGFASQICEATNRMTYFVDYGLGPDIPVPKCVGEVVSVYTWLVRDQALAPTDIIIIGDSAGGGLAFLAALELKKLGTIGLPGAIWVMSPWTDLSCSLSSWKTHLQSDVMLNPLDFTPGSVCLEHATGIANSTVAQLQDPSISPYFSSDVTGLPPCLIQVGGAECLLSDAIEMHKKLIVSRVKSTLQIYDHQQHIFQLYYDWIPEASAAISAGCKWISQFDV